MINKKVLIFGASGLIGSYFYKFLKQKRIEVLGTYTNNAKEGLIYYDLIKSDINDIPLNNVQYAIICSAVTKLDKCKEDSEYSNLVNIESTKKLIKNLRNKGIIPVFLSSASVFDGIKGNYVEEDIKNPITLYGKQKAEIDDFIENNLKDYLIIRPGKVFGIKKGEGVLFSEWYNKYLKNEEILCADDERLSPHYVEDVSRGIFSLLNIDARGIYHINPPENFSRYEMVINFFNFLKIEDVKIVRCSIDNFNFAEKRPRNTYLNASKFIKKTNFKFTRLEDCYRMVTLGYKNTYIPFESNQGMKNNVYNQSKLAFHKDKLFSLLNGKVTAPVYVRIKPTNKCNHACYYCSYVPGNECPVSENIDYTDEIPRDKMMEILDDFKEIGVKAITFSGGGEPLIYPHIVEVMKKVLEYGMDLSIITNGQELKGEKAEVLKNAEWVRISLDSVNPKVFAETRRRPESWFHELEENIRNFTKIKKPDCEFGINFVVQEKNKDEIYETAKYFKNLGVNHVKFTPVYMPNFLEYHQDLKAIVEEQIKRAREDFDDKNFTVYDTYKNDFELTGLDKRKYPQCFIMQIIPVIGADSVVYFCHDKTYTENGALGSIKDQSFKDLWFSKEVKEIFKNFDPKKGCQHHCTYDSRNLLLQYLLKNINKLIEECKPDGDKHKNFI